MELYRSRIACVHVYIYMYVHVVFIYMYVRAVFIYI